MRRRPRDGEAEEELPAGPYYPRTADVKLTVVSKEGKIEEIQAEIACLYQQLESISEKQSDLKDRLRETIEALNKQIRDMK